ncbi:hypothetical protein PM082_009311 [Marasmius tenuissimus]|nr:hypothetical protein PM082_009311 [Marasmius tenuissimus]
MPLKARFGWLNPYSPSFIVTASTLHALAQVALEAVSIYLGTRAYAELEATSSCSGIPSCLG